MISEYYNLMNNRKSDSCNLINGVKVYEKGNSVYNAEIKRALDVYYLESLLEEGECGYCNAITSQFCSYCGLHYCSILCQKADWPRHQSKCESFVFSSSNESALGSECSFTEPENKFQGSNCKSALKKPERCKTITEGKRLISNRAINDIEKKSLKEDNSIISNGQPSVAEIDDPEEQEVDTPIILPNIFYNIKEPLKKGQVIFVKCTSWEWKYYWVIEVSDLKKFKYIQELLYDNSENYPFCKDPVKNEIYAVLFNNKLHRGKILNVSPKPRVRCLDTGRIFFPSTLICRVLPPEIKNIEGTAFRIEFTDNKVKKQLASRIIQVEIVNIKRERIFEVKMSNRGPSPRENVSVTSDEPVKEPTVRKIENIRRRCVIDELSVGHSGLFLPMKIDGDTLYGSLVPENIEDAEYSHVKISTLHCMDTESIDADIGDFVLVSNGENLGRRGFVKAKSKDFGYEVCLLDYGYTIKTTTVYEMPESAADLVELASKITIRRVLSWEQPLEVDTPYFFDIKAQLSEGEWLCSLRKEPVTETPFAEAIVEKSEETCGEKYVPLEAGARVVISAAVNDTTVYLRRVDGNWEDQLVDLSVKINRLPEQLEETTNINVGDIVIAKFKEDGLWYRAKIVSKDDDEIKVLFVDYGNEQVSDITEINELPEHMKETQFFARKVKLMGNSKTVTVPGKKYLAKLIMESKELDVVYYDEMTECAILSEKDARAEVNQFLYGEVPLSPVKEMKRSDSDISISKLQAEPFSTGRVDNFIILYVDRTEFMDGGVFWAVDRLNETFTYIVKCMAQKINDYCNDHEDDEYHPKDGEFCFALFEDDWYRAVCLKQDGDLYEVFYIDFGNTALVDPKSVRKMYREYFSLPPTAVKCVYNEFGKCDQKTLEKVFDFLMTNTNECLENVMVEAVEDDLCYISFNDLDEEE